MNWFKQLLRDEGDMTVFEIVLITGLGGLAAIILVTLVGTNFADQILRWFKP